MQSSAGRRVVCSARGGLSRVCYNGTLYPSNEGNPLVFWWIAVTLLWPGRGDFSASGLSTFKKIALTSALDCTGNPTAQGERERYSRHEWSTSLRQDTETKSCPWTRCDFKGAMRHGSIVSTNPQMNITETFFFIFRVVFCKWKCLEATHKQLFFERTSRQFWGKEFQPTVPQGPRLRTEERSRWRSNPIRVRILTNFQGEHPFTIRNEILVKSY